MDFKTGFHARPFNCFLNLIFSLNLSREIITNRIQPYYLIIQGLMADKLKSKVNFPYVYKFFIEFFKTLLYL